MLEPLGNRWMHTQAVAARAHELMPGNRLELFGHAGHFPHLDEPLRFVRVLRDFVATTEPADVRPQDARELMLARAA